MKLGLDFHGVMTDNNQLFSMLAKMIIASGGEVHVITGARKDTFLKQVEEYGVTIPYTHFFSISDYHIELGTDVDLTDPNFPKMNNKLWDVCKADYCSKFGIDLMVDDSPHYGEHFSTPYMLYRNDQNEDMFKYDLIKDIRQRAT